jgi:hypothetical protein
MHIQAELEHKAVASSRNHPEDDESYLWEYLTSQDGAKCWAKVTQGHADTKGTEANNDKFSESVFGVFDRMLKTEWYTVRDL